MKTTGKVEKPFIVPVFIPHAGCPHQCVFCNQKAITSVDSQNLSPKDLRNIITSFLKFKGGSRNEVQISFYGGTFLGLETDYIKLLMNEATQFVNAGEVDSIRFSTRPDTIDEKRLNLLSAFPVSTIELGVQSMDDSVLTMSGRGHTALDTEKAVKLLKERNYKIGLQMMAGLPGDNARKALTSARRIAKLNPDFVRIYPTVVLEGSPLAQWHAKGIYSPLPLEQCVKLVKELYLLFCSNKITVIRMGLQASEDFKNDSRILAGPYHPAFGHMIFSQIFLDMAVSILETDSAFGLPAEAPSRHGLAIHVHPRSISKMRGLKNSNIKILKEKFGIAAVDVVADVSLATDMIRIGETMVDISCLVTQPASLP